MSRFFLTTAIDYVNSRPHLGTAYEKVCADVIARYQRLCGVDTHFLMGNDEHSQNVFKKAKEEGLEPLAYCDRMEQIFRETTTIGLRHYDVDRECLRREMVTVETPVGAVRFKVAWRNGRIVNAAPEFEDCVQLAASANLSVKEVQALAVQAFHTGRS